MLPTPSTSHVDVNLVYEPAEDSFLFLDTLSSAAESLFLKERFGQDPGLRNRDGRNPSPLVVEVGVGSGVVLGFLTAHARRILGRNDVLSLGVDVNWSACQASTETVRLACRAASNGSHESASFFASLNADLTSIIRPGTVDLLICNPPYVPTAEVPRALEDCTDGDNHNPFGEEANLISLSYAGGMDGMEVTNRLLEQLPSALNPKRGVAYILLCEQNRPKEVVQRIRQWGAGWTVDVAGRSGKHGGWEKLQILRICRGGQPVSRARELEEKQAPTGSTAKEDLTNPVAWI
ncbi:MAG: hypothetical protein LQ344_000063 [Seirophora lacunosa]|nr:MAG: hypothetical protein LQ344_000063 [Seirophora lacunosa]